MWSKDYFLLAQGQAVSALGSTLYSVAAGLWAYELTGSTVMMSLVYSAANLARLAAFPFAGVIVDRFPRRNLIVACDVLCGVSMLAVAGAAWWGSPWAVWALVAHSMVSGGCSGVFNSSVNALMLAIVKKRCFIRANSVYSAIEYGVDILGQGIGGTLYVLLGAPWLFLLNGISFLFSAFTEGFITRDAGPNRREPMPFWRDAGEGLRYMLSSRGICLNLLLAFLINAVFGVLRVALVPWMAPFGPACYGWLGSFRSAGAIVGTLLLTLGNIPADKQYGIWFWGQIIFVTCIGAAALLESFLPVALLFFLAYVNQSLFNSLQRSVVIIAAPDEVRGKVLCAVQALAMGFSAAGNLTGGVLCQRLSPRLLVFVLMALLGMEIVAVGRRNSLRALFRS